MNAARENILARVRSALSRRSGIPAATGSGEIWPPIIDPLGTFQQEFTTIKGEIIPDLPAFLTGFPKIASNVAEVTGNATVREADLGVTGCDCLIARTGSIAVCTRSAGGRALSVLPPVHLVIARRDQIVPDLEFAFSLWKNRYGEYWPSNLSIITGPSRTADIEQTLNLGVHGPKHLHVVVIAA